MAQMLKKKEKPTERGVPAVTHPIILTAPKAAPLEYSNENYLHLHIFYSYLSSHAALSACYALIVFRLSVLPSRFLFLLSLYRVVFVRVIF